MSREHAAGVKESAAGIEGRSAAVIENG